MKQRYYFFTATGFADRVFDTDEDAVAAKAADCIRVMRARDSHVIWEKPVESKPA